MTAITPDVQYNGAMRDELTALTNKREAIATACQRKNFADLIELANSEGGLLDNEMRRTAWPLLLGVTNQDKQSTANENWQNLPKHRDEEQIQKDVDRAFVYYPSDETQKTLETKRTELFNLIIRVLRINPMLHYFQGYHDIAQVCLLVVGQAKAFAVVSRVSLLRIRDYMLPSLGPTIKHLLLIPAILECADPGLANHLGQIQPYFAMSAVLTLYAHDVEGLPDIARLYDFILAHEPVMIIYLFAALVINSREKLLELESGDHDMLHFTLSKLAQSLHVQALVDRSLEIYKAHPPETLPGRVWRRLSSYSVLKTSREGLREQSLAEARSLYDKQSRLLALEEMSSKTIKQMHKNRRPIISFGATVIVGVLSYYLRKNGHDRALWSTLWRIQEVFRW